MLNTECIFWKNTVQNAAILLLLLYYSIPRLNQNLANSTLTKPIDYANKTVETRGQIVEGQPLC